MAVPRPITVSTELQLQLVVPGASTLPVRAELSYDKADPYAVKVVFHTGRGEDSDAVEWTFARQLLTDGVTGHAGHGDVRVWPASPVPPAPGELEAPVQTVSLSLSSPSGQALFALPLRELVDFLSMSYQVVPTGAESEHVDLDGELSAMLWGDHSA